MHDDEQKKWGLMNKKKEKKISTAVEKVTLFMAKACSEM